MPGGIHPPLRVILSWPKPNYVNPVTRPNTVLFVACIYGPLTILLLFARLWVRVRMQRSAGWDDWLMIAALPFIIALTVLIPLLTDYYDYNKHVWDVKPPTFIIQRKLILAIEVTFCVASGLIKVSILLFYRRISSRSVSSTFRWVTWLSIAFIVAYSLAFTLVPIFGCNPISAFWDQVDMIKVLRGYTYKCFNEGADVFSAAVISAVQDLITTMLPNILFWNLRIPIRQKMALFAIFAIGYGVVAVGALRCYTTWRTFFETYDVTWQTNTWLYALLELHLGATCANAPALKVFVKEYLKLERLTSRSKTDSNGSRNKAPSASHSNPRSTDEKLTFTKLSSSHNDNGDLSQLHNQMSVDTHGEIQIRKDFRVSNLTHSSSEFIIDRYNDFDIEMGSFETHSQASGEDLQALPRFEYQTDPHAAVRRPHHTVATRHNLGPFLLTAKKPPT